MTRSLLFQFVGLTAVVTAIVGALLIYVVPNGQRQELEASATAELSSLAAAYAVSVTSALEQEDLEALAGLNSSVRDDPRNLTVAIISGFEDDAELFAVFPGDSDVTTADIDSEGYLVARQPVSTTILEGTVVVMIETTSISQRVEALNTPLYAAFLIFLALQIIYARQLSVRVLLPIIEAGGIADRLGREDYQGALRKHNRDDGIGQLASSLRRLKTNLRLKNRENRRILASLEDTVEERTAELTKALEAKDSFTASVSHELRTPLHSIIASLDLMSAEQQTKENGEYLVIAKRGAKTLLLLINELLDFQRWEQESVVLKEEAIELRHFVSGIGPTINTLFGDSDVEFVIQNDLPSPIWVMVDPNRLAQVLINLLGNARKFTNTGSVTFEASVLQDSPIDAEVLFAVVDTGMGISPEDVKRIDEPYFQAAEGLNRKFSGTGLGLNIVKRISEAMFSRLNVSSEVGVGSVFDFSIRLAKSDAVERSEALLSGIRDKEAAPLPPEQRRFLYVEDSITNQLVMTAMLDRLGVSHEVVSSATEGITKLRSERFDVLITDIQMPEFSGIDLLDWVTQDAGESEGARVFACTANANTDAIAEFKAMGFQGVLTKPLSIEDLTSFLKSLG